MQLTALVGVVAAAGAISLVSVRNEIEIGRAAQKQVRQRVTELTDATIVSYVRDVGRRLAARAPGPRYPYGFDIANYREINAFALPGGPVWIHRGAIEAATTEAQMAGVLAHEVAHIAERHAADQLTKAMVANGLLGLLGSVLGNEGGARTAQIGAGLFAQGLFLKFSRDDEREADRTGARIVHRAGWDPDGMVEFFRILRERAKRDPSSLEVFLSSHPSPDSRATELRRVTAGMKGGRRDSAQFQQIRQRLGRMPAAGTMPRR
jgi:predicted Zn-dependent protease